MEGVPASFFCCSCSLFACWNMLAGLGHPWPVILSLFFPLFLSVCLLRSLLPSFLSSSFLLPPLPFSLNLRLHVPSSLRQSQ